jgi:hypothetical protein
MSETVRLVFTILASIIFCVSWLSLIRKIWTTKSSKEHTLISPISGLMGLVFLAASLWNLPDVKNQFISLIAGIVMNVLYIVSILWFREKA